MQAVKTFLKEANKGDSTEVCSEVAPEVVQEHVRPQERVETAEAVDVEKHVHHHQHRVQPVEDHRVLETKHVEQTLPTLTREHKEEMNPEHKMKLDQQRTMHHSEHQVGDVERSAAHVGTHSNEHVHHHIHETITPVIQRETVQPTTVHTVQPIHQVVHEAPIVHEATTLPTISLDELRAKAHDGPHLHKDGDHTHQFYEGAPRVGGANDSTGTTGTGHSSHTGTHTGSHTGSGATGAVADAATNGTTGHSHTGSHTGTGIAGAAAGAAAKHEHNKN